MELIKLMKFRLFWDYLKSIISWPDNMIYLSTDRCQCAFIELYSSYLLVSCICYIIDTISQIWWQILHENSFLSLSLSLSNWISEHAFHTVTKWNTNLIPPTRFCFLLWLLLLLCSLVKNVLFLRFFVLYTQLHCLFQFVCCFRISTMVCFPNFS